MNIIEDLLEQIDAEEFIRKAAAYYQEHQIKTPIKLEKDVNGKTLILMNQQ